MAEAIERPHSPPDTGPTAASAPASAAPPSLDTTQRGRVDIASSSSPRAASPIATIASLIQRFQNETQLNSYLLSLSKAELAAIIISEAGKSSSSSSSTTVPPAPESNKYAHCVYCHEIFDKEYNVGCQVKHHGHIEEIDYDTSEFTCCGLSLDYTDYDSQCHAAPEDEEPYCYEGGHRDRLINQEDRVEGTWWQGWEKSRRTCSDMGCRGMVNPKKRR
ncbi:hypothetical protein C7212DRAFT_348661 [Tuber magnatum]|uniref:C2H2-type domain-containing protein n=1 Tax=Tuber magnatum TaxID=42249 RepID=A0A317SEA9_9PEZI|nr:hypothetical protein C7212DRAFT_348661 [Tuber magnatum]